MKTNKEYRFNDNPKEKEFHDKFKQLFERDTTLLSAIIFGWSDNIQKHPKDFLTDKQEDVCLNLIQWLGSPVGQEFLDSCGFTLTKTNIK
jgi:hypothetical protein